MRNLAFSLRIPLLATAVWLGFQSHSHAEAIDVTDKQGRTISARLLASDEKTVQFERVSDRKRFTLALDSLDEKTCAAIKDWVDKGGNLMEKYEVTFNSGKTGRTTGAEDFDDKRVNMKPVVIVKNPDANRESRPLKLTVVVLGKPVLDRSSIYVFATKTFDMPKIAPLRTEEFELEAISEPYDDSNYAKFGNRYLGYVWVIHEDGDRVVDCASVPSALVGDKAKAKAFLQLEEERIYDRDFAGR